MENKEDVKLCMCKNFLKETKNPHYGGANDMRLLKLLCQKHGQWTCDESFISKIWQRIGRMNCGVFEVFPVELSAHILSMCP